MTIIGKACTLAILALPATARADASELLREYGTSFSVGAGFVQFTHDSMRVHATEGVGWEGRLAFGTRKGFVAELGYLGTLHDVDALGLDTHATLLGTNLEGVFKIPFPIGRLEPYILFGAGWGRLTITNTMTTTSEMQGSDNFVTYPFGGGVAFKRQEMVLDLRTVYRAAGNIDLLPSADARLDTWSTTLSLGVEY